MSGLGWFYLIGDTCGLIALVWRLVDHVSRKNDEGTP